MVVEVVCVCAWWFGGDGGVCVGGGFECLVSCCFCPLLKKPTSTQLTGAGFLHTRGGAGTVGTDPPRVPPRPGAGPHSVHSGELGPEAQGQAGIAGQNGGRSAVTQLAGGAIVGKPSTACLNSGEALAACLTEADPGADR